MKHYACAILVEDGRILLGLRAPHRRAYAGKWDVIGGLVEPGETVEQALGRELGEEIGVAPVTALPLGEVIDASPEARGIATYHMFAVTAWSGGPPAMCNNEHSALTWFGVEEACALPELALEEYRAVFRRIEAA
jgi:8-oxo-dGTP pyrophosphatase MutT (NUDIX family)